MSQAEAAEANPLARWKYLLERLREHPPAPGSADIFCMGQGDGTQTAVFTAAMTLLGHRDTPYAEGVTVILPPAAPNEPTPDSLTDGIVTMVSALSEQVPSPAMRSWLKRRVTIVRATNLEATALLACFPAEDGRRVVLIPAAARYGHADVAEPKLAEIHHLEDTWITRLAATARQIVAHCKAKGHYALLDAGEDPPTSRANLERLMSIDDCGVITGALDGDNGPQLGELLPRWRDLLAAGRAGSVLGEIDSLEITSGAKRRFKIQIMSRGGLHVPAMALLKDVLAEREALAPEVALAFAEAAFTAHEQEIAARLLAEAGPNLSDLMLLERALHLADSLAEPESFEATVRRTEALFPNAPVLADAKARNAFEKRDHRMASEVLTAAGREEDGAFYAWLADALDGEAPDLDAVPAALQAQWPDYLGPGLIAAALEAEAAGDRRGAVRLLLARGSFDEASVGEVMQLLRLMRLRLLHGGDEHDLDLELHAVLLAAFAFLGAHPDTAQLRVRVGRLISPDVSGTRGFLAAVTAILALLQEFPLAARQAEPAEYPEIDTVGLCKAVMRWFEAEGVVGIGRTTVPAEVLPKDFHPAVDRELLRTLEHMGRDLATDEDADSLIQVVCVIAALSPHLADPDTDLNAFRVAAAQLIVSGRPQKARDLVEVVLQIAGERPDRRRLSWFTYGDTYQRTRDHGEALLAFGAGLSSVAVVSTGQAWTEGLALVRLFRDIGAIEPAREVLERVRQVVEASGLQEANQGILDTLGLQLELSAITTTDTPDPAALADLLERAAKTCREALSYPPELPPIASLLGQVIRVARTAGVSVTDEAEALLKTALDRLGEPLATYLRVHQATAPRAEDLAAIAGRIDPARFAVDVAYDVGNLAVLSRRYLAGAARTDDPKLAAYAIELLADLAVAADDAGGALPKIPDDPDMPFETARAISRTGLGVVLVGLDEQSKLVRVQFADGDASPLVREDEAVFDSVAYEAWRRQYPYHYGFIDEPRRSADGRRLREVDLGGFIQTLEKIGVSELPPQRVVLVLDTSLQVLPPNILKVGDDLAGRTRAMAMAPSLSWLRHAGTLRDRAAGPSVAWISTASAGEGLPTLGMMAERLQPALKQHGIALDTGASTPQALKGAELAIVGAHGGLHAAEGRYFQGVADEDRLRMEMRALAGALTGAKVAVLFVCSGGRLDASPHGRAALGLARRLLDEGCSTVIGSPWPMSASVPPHWLPTFLEAWEAGLPVIDANQYANDAVSRTLGDGPELCLAMSVYGDPLVRKIDI
jgi:hypothetical protein